MIHKYGMDDKGLLALLAQGVGAGVDLAIEKAKAGELLAMADVDALVRSMKQEIDDRLFAARKPESGLVQPDGSPVRVQ